MNRVIQRPAFWVLSAFAVFAIFAGIDPVYAADATPGGGSGLPWEGPVDRLRQSISGPVAFTIALLGLVACGATLIWGGEISEFTRRIIYLVLVICIIVFANTLLTGALFTGAVIPDGAIFDLAEAQQLNMRATGA